MTRSGNYKRGSEHWNWRGGKTTDKQGYLYVKVAKGHHLANAKGYALEHRLVMEKVLGRRLTSGEIVHHIDGNKSNNLPKNLELISSNSTHSVLHHPAIEQSRVLKLITEHGLLKCATIAGLLGRTVNLTSCALQQLRKKGFVKLTKGRGLGVWHLSDDDLVEYLERMNPLVFCACGCGEMRRKYDGGGKRRKYILFHGRRKGNG